MNHLDLFSGIGGFALAARWAGIETVAFCEIEPFCQRVLRKNFPGVPIYNDVKELRNDGSIRAVDIISGGFPCQPFSCAGKRRGKADNRDLWPQMFRIVQEFRPSWVLGENVFGFVGMELDRTITDLEREGYSCRAFIVPACAVGAPHRRDRVWVVANATSPQCNAGTEKQGVLRTLSEDGAEFNHIDRSDTAFGFGGGIASDSDRQGPQGLRRLGECRGESPAWQSGWEEPWIEVASRLCGVFNGFSDFLDRCFDDVILEGDYVQIKRNGAKNLSILREAIQQEQIWERFGKQYKVEEKEILLSFLCRIEERTNRQNDICTESERASQRKMRNLWINAEFRRSPQRREYQEQLARECTNIVPQLPYEIALEITKMWDYLSLAYSSIKTSNRVHRLRALGNSIVPQVAYRILAAIVEIEKGEK